MTALLISLMLILFSSPAATAASMWQWQLALGHSHHAATTVSLKDMIETVSTWNQWQLQLGVQYTTCSGLRAAVHTAATATTGRIHGWDFTEENPVLAERQRSLALDTPQLQLTSPAVAVAGGAIRVQLTAPIARELPEAALLWQTVQDPLLIRMRFGLQPQPEHWRWEAVGAAVLAANHIWSLGWQTTLAADALILQTDLIHHQAQYQTTYSLMHGLTSGFWKAQVHYSF